MDSAQAKAGQQDTGEGGEVSVQSRVENFLASSPLLESSRDQVKLRHVNCHTE